MIFRTLQEQIQSQGQQRKISLFPALTGHQQEQQNYQKIFRIQIRREQAAQIAASSGRRRAALRLWLLRKRWLAATTGGWLRWWRRRWGWRLKLRGIPALLGNTVPPETTIGLGNISVIHALYLLWSNWDAADAILAARIARSSLDRRSRLM